MRPNKVVTTSKKTSRVSGNTPSKKPILTARNINFSSKSDNKRGIASRIFQWIRSFLSCVWFSKDNKTKKEKPSLDFNNSEKKNFLNNSSLNNSSLNNSSVNSKSKKIFANNIYNQKLCDIYREDLKEVIPFLLSEEGKNVDWLITDSEYGSLLEFMSEKLICWDLIWDISTEVLDKRLSPQKKLKLAQHFFKNKKIALLNVFLSKKFISLLDPADSNGLLECADSDGSVVFEKRHEIGEGNSLLEDNNFLMRILQELQKDDYAQWIPLVYTMMTEWIRLDFECFKEKDTAYQEFLSAQYQTGVTVKEQLKNGKNIQIKNMYDQIVRS